MIGLDGTASNGTYELYSFTGTAPPLNDFTLGVTPGGGFNYTLAETSNQIDVIVNNTAAAAWNNNGDGNWGDNTKWLPTNIPQGAGQTATFGNGDGLSPQTTINAATVTVTVNGAFPIGQMMFNNTNGTSYTIASDGVGGDGLTLDGGRDRQLRSAVTSGSHAISAPLTLADSGGNNTFALSPGTSLNVSGPIGQTGGSKRITVSGGGTLTLSNANTYSGGTTVNSGTLRTTADGALGTGPLAVNSTSGATNVNIQSIEANVGALTGTVTGGSAQVNVSAGKCALTRQLRPRAPRPSRARCRSPPAARRASAAPSPAAVRALKYHGPPTAWQ